MGRDERSDNYAHYRTVRPPSSSGDSERRPWTPYESEVREWTERGWQDRRAQDWSNQGISKGKEKGSSSTGTWKGGKWSASAWWTAAGSSSSTWYSAEGRGATPAKSASMTDLEFWLINVMILMMVCFAMYLGRSLILRAFDILSKKETMINDKSGPIWISESGTVYHMYDKCGHIGTSKIKKFRCCKDCAKRKSE
jgi:hypothetical protein